MNDIKFYLYTTKVLILWCFFIVVEGCIALQIGRTASNRYVDCLIFLLHYSCIVDFRFFFFAYFIGHLSNINSKTRLLMQMDLILCLDYILRLTFQNCLFLFMDSC